MTVAVDPVPGEGTRENNRIQYQVALRRNSAAVPESPGVTELRSPDLRVILRRARRPHYGCRHRSAGGGRGALLALLLVLVLWMKLRRVRTAQTRCWDQRRARPRDPRREPRDRFRAAAGLVEETFRSVEAAPRAGRGRIQRSISKTAVVRYDAYGEMSGRQSSSMALLDDTGTGVVLSSILHRDQARMYVKGVRDGHSDIELSPEEDEAIRTALGAPVVAETR